MKTLSNSKTLFICTLILVVSIGSIKSQNIISPTQWEDTTLTQSQANRMEKVNNYFGAEAVTKIQIAPITSAIDNLLSIDIPTSDCSATNFKGKSVAFETEDNFTWYGELSLSPSDSCANCRNGYLFLMARGGEKFGSIKIEDEYYSIEDIGGKNLLVKHPTGDGYIESCGGTLDAEYQGEDIGTANARDGNCDVTVLVLYTQAANEQINNIENLIEQSIAITNQALANSSISTCELHFELAAIEQININEGSKTFLSVLTELVNNSNASTRRDFHNADIVVLFVDKSLMAPSTTAGLAYLGPSNPFAYGVVRSIGVNNGYVFSHEVGHILGARHEPCDAEDAGSNCDDVGIFEHAHTWSYKTGCWPFRKDHDRRTIMYSVGVSDPDVIPNYSNPYIKEDGQKTGIINERDNQRILDNNACTVANFRTSDTDDLSVSINGPFKLCVIDQVILSADIDGTPGPYTYEWKVSSTGLDWEVVPVYSINSQITIGTFMNGYNLGDNIFVRLEVATSTGDIDIAYHSMEVVEGAENGCPHSSNHVAINESIFEVYPNPTKKDFTLSFSLLSESDVKIIIYEMNGKIVKSIDKGVLPVGYYRENIDFSGSESSTYYLELIKDKEIERVPIIMIK